MPKAAVYENRDLGASEDNVCSAPKAGQRLEVHAVAEAGAVKATAYLELGLRVTCANGLHVSSSTGSRGP